MTDKHPRVIPGADAFFYQGNETGILLCHGFNGTPQSVEYVGKRLAEKGYTVFAPRLSGHGTNEHDMELFSYDAWIEDMEKAYRILHETCNSIYIAGQSMGGALALNLSQSVNCSGVITINAALEVPCYQKYLSVNAPCFIPEGAPDIHDRLAEEITYSRVPVRSIKELLKLLPLVKERLPQVTCPALIFKSPLDHIVPAECSDVIYELISSTRKDMISLSQSYHVATLDYDKTIIAECIHDFIDKNSASLTHKCTG